MTKDEYMQALKNNIQALTLDEQNEALQYYYDYFEEAGDDEKVMEELGTPEDVAALINERFANAMVKQNSDSKENHDEAESENCSEGSLYDALYYTFDNDDVKNLELNFGASEIVIIKGKNYSVETRGVMKENFLCRLDTEGTLIVKNLKKINGLNFWNHERVSRIVPRILITIPETAEIDKLKINLGAGKLNTKNIVLYCRRGNIEVGAGSCILGNIYGNDVNIRCGMGSVKIIGKLTGRSDIDCGMGAVKLELQGDVKDYSYDAKVGLGDFKMNDEKKSGVCQSFSDNRLKNHFSVNCGMGSVNISLQNI